MSGHVSLLRSLQIRLLQVMSGKVSSDHLGSYEVRSGKVRSGQVISVPVRSGKVGSGEVRLD